MGCPEETPCPDLKERPIEEQLSDALTWASDTSTAAEHYLWEVTHLGGELAKAQAERDLLRKRIGPAIEAERSLGKLIQACMHDFHGGSSVGREAFEVLDQIAPFWRVQGPPPGPSPGPPPEEYVAQENADTELEG